MMDGGTGVTTMTSDFKVVQVPEGDYLRLVKEAQENAEKDFPFTIDELHQLLVLESHYNRGEGSPLREKLSDMFDKLYYKERRG